MNTLRVISRIDVKGPNLVKGIHLEGLRVLGAPHLFAKHYYAEGVDEIIYMDVVASLYGRNSVIDLVSKTASDVFIPITVGGGIRTTEDIKMALRSGADKVSINTAAISNPTFISDAANMFGSSTVVVAIEAIQQPDEQYLAFVNNGREHTDKEVVEWALEAEKLGAGEIMLTSVDREGTGKGMDIKLINKVVNAVKIPVIAHGGVGCIHDVVNVANTTNCNAVSLASVLHYCAMTKVDNEIPDEQGNRYFLSSAKTVKYVQPATITEIKQELSRNGVQVRL